LKVVEIENLSPLIILMFFNNCKDQIYCQVFIMGKTQVREGSKAPLLSKKALRAPSSSAAPSTAKGTKDA